MKNILIAFLFLFSLDCIAQDSINSINFEFQDDYFSTPPSLYLKCRNDVYFFIAADTNLEKLSYKVGGGSLIIQDSSKVISLIPTASKVTLEVFYDGKMIVEQKFNVKLTPKPTINIRNFDKTVKRFPKKIDIGIFAEDVFRHNNIYDSNYEVGSYTVSLVMGEKLMAEKEFTKNEEFTKKEIKKYIKIIKAEPNEDWKLVVKIDEIQRTNYKNELEKTRLSIFGAGQTFVFPIKLE
jgi:hypothetical protein